MRCKSLRRFSDEAIGVVYPIYGHRPPKLVERFLREVTLDTPYLYIIPTYGARHANAVEIASDICREAGKAPAYIRTLLMADNYLPAFDMDEQRALDKDVDGQLAGIKADLAARKHYIEPVTDATGRRTRTSSSTKPRCPRTRSPAWCTPRRSASAAACARGSAPAGAYAWKTGGRASTTQTARAASPVPTPARSGR